MFWSELRRLTSLAVVGVSALTLAACSQIAAQRREASYEVDPVPAFYVGPLTVQYEGVFGPEIFYSEHGWRRIEHGEHIHSIEDPVRRQAYFWYDWSPNAPLDVRPISRRERASARRWRGVTKAQLRGPCEAAGEKGSLYMIVRGPDFEAFRVRRYMACLTSDGVLLSEGLPWPEGYRPHREATKVVRGPLPAGLFKPRS